MREDIEEITERRRLGVEVFENYTCHLATDKMYSSPLDKCFDDCTLQLKWLLLDRSEHHPKANKGYKGCPSIAVSLPSFNDAGIEVLSHNRNPVPEYKLDQQSFRMLQQ